VDLITKDFEFDEKLAAERGRKEKKEGKRKKRRKNRRQNVKITFSHFHMITFSPSQKKNRLRRQTMILFI
jgi:hypothetical protein